MRVLFNLNTPVHLRYFDSTIEHLGARGHQVFLTFTLPHAYPESLEILPGFARPPANLGRAPRREDDFALAASGLRAAVDYARYLDRSFARAEFLRNRARGRALRYGPFARPFASLRRLRPWQADLLVRGLLAVERAVPSSPEIEGFIRSVGADVVLVSPLTTGASPQADYVKSARALGIPSAVCVPSWDNLTNKGHMKVVPDRVIVWNRAQLREAVELHDVPASRVAVTGAQPFDRWFGRTPSTSRDDFCAKVGLSPDRPFVLYCASRSNIGEGVEQAFVDRWVKSIRENGGPLGEEVGVLVRPHPERPGCWDGALEAYPEAVVWPPRILNSIAPGTRTDYFDSLYHSAAVVGINTSAMIEAAIIGRPVLTVRAPEFAESHEGTLHFRYLRPEHGGFLREAGSLEEHMVHLAEAIADPRKARSLNSRFVGEFVRPNGLDRPCTPILVDVIERLGGERRIAPRPSVPRRAGQAGLRLLARGIAARERPPDPGPAKRRAKRASRFFERLAKRTSACHKRASAVSRLLADRARARGYRRSARLRRKKEEHRRRRAEREQLMEQVAERGARLLDPEGG